jgi:hypothetical protein
MLSTASHGTATTAPRTKGLTIRPRTPGRRAGHAAGPTSKAATVVPLPIAPRSWMSVDPSAASLLAVDELVVEHV